MSRLEVPPAERIERHLLLLEDEAQLSRQSVATLVRLLPRLHPCYDLLSLDASDNFCAHSRRADALWRWLRLPPRWRQLPRLVRVRACYSRTTGLLISYKGALSLLSNLPVTRTLDLWYRDLMTDRLLQAYVACPPVLAPNGTSTLA